MPVPKISDIFFEAQPVFLHRKGEGSLLLSEFESPSTILIKQQHHSFSLWMFHPPPPTQQIEDAHVPFFFFLLILLIRVNDIDCVDYYFKKKMEKNGKKCYPRPSTWYPRPRHGTFERLFRSDFRFRSILYTDKCAHICLAPSQNSNVWRPNIHL